MMRIRRIRLREFRGVTEREVGFEPRGVTILEGSNETGKTSLAEAIAIVFDLPDSTHKQLVRELQPVNRDTGTEIEVEVEAGPYRFTLRKRFNKDRETVLHVVAPRIEHWTGREAHARARAILEETIDVDLWRALCVQQGRGGMQAALGASPSLVAALDAAAGGSPQVGDAELTLLERARSEYLRYFTEKGSAARLLRDATAATVSARDALIAAEERLGELEADVERAAQLDAQLDDARAAADRAGRNHAEAQAAADHAALQAATVDRLARDCALAELAEASARRDLETRAERVAEAERLRVEGMQHAEEAAEARERGADAQVALTSATDELEALEHEAETIESMRTIRQADLDGMRERESLDAALRQRARVGDALRAAAAARERLSHLRVDDAAVHEIRRLDLALREARAARAAGSPRVTIAALGSQPVLVGGEPMGTAEATVAAIEPLVVEVAGAVRVTVGPGAGGTDLEAACTAATRALATACAAAGVDGLAHAERVAIEASETRRALADAESVVEQHLGGRRLDDLDEEIAFLEHRAVQREAHRPALPPPPDGLEEAQALARAAEAAVRTLEVRFAGALARHQAAVLASESARATVARETALAERAAIRRDEALAALERARSLVPDDQLPAQLAGAVATARSATAALDAARAGAAGLDPAAATGLARNAADVLAAARRRLRQLEDERREVAARLQVRGEQALFDAREDAAADLGAAERNELGLTRRAHAARALYETLVRCRDTARAAYQEPLRATIEELGRILFGPSFAVELDADLQIDRRILDGEALPFRMLSAGAQEQLALLSRLASAMLVSTDGGVPLILDDTLGASDPDRLDRMGAVLRLAGTRCQVIVLTCFPQRFRSVGGAAVVQLVA